MERVTATQDASWLPSGGRAEVWRGDEAPSPAALVRLLLRRDDTVFCVPRDDGRIDLPTRPVAADDPDGSAAATALARAVTGADSHAAPIGFVRNIVSSSAAGYPWPTPLAHFTVWTAAAAPRIGGEWVSIAPGSLLAGRHWFPLVGSAARSSESRGG